MQQNHQVKIEEISVDQMSKAAEQILAHYPNQRLFLLVGDLGAGKTTLVQHFARLLDSSDEISSPTFSIINEYHSSTNKIYHIDLYRLNTQEEAEEIGIEEYLYSGEYCFIEWPQIIEPLLPESLVLIKIEATSSGNRTISLTDVQNT